MTKGEYVGDANELTTNGIYACESAVQNVPIAVSYLICLASGRVSLKCLQICVGYTNNGVYMRTNHVGNWTTWRQLSML